MINCPYCENFREDRVEPEHRVTQKNRGFNHRGCQHPTSGGLNSSIPPSIFCLSALFTCLAFWTFTKQQSLCQTMYLVHFYEYREVNRTYIKHISKPSWVSVQGNRHDYHSEACHAAIQGTHTWETDRQTITHMQTHTRTHACTHAQARAHTFHGGAVLSGIRAPLLEGQHLPLILGKLLSS